MAENQWLLKILSLSPSLPLNLNMQVKCVIAYLPW